MNDKFLIRIAIAAFATLMLAFAAVEGISYMSPKTDVAASMPQPHQDVPHVGVIIRDTQTANPASDQPAPQVQTASFTLPVSNAVDISDLRNLAAAVHLKNAKLADVDKDQWKKALPKAQQLLQGACDCEQRNWLTHFVETGNYALTGAKEFEDSAKLVISLPKNDEEATTHQISD